jgi:hypothetical protein
MGLIWLTKFLLKLRKTIYFWNQLNFWAKQCGATFSAKICSFAISNPTFSIAQKKPHQILVKGIF